MQRLHMAPAYGASNACIWHQEADFRDLVRDLRGVVQDYCTYFWGELGAVQVARGLTATPHALCSMSLSVHLSAARTQ